MNSKSVRIWLRQQGPKTFQRALELAQDQIAVLTGENLATGHALPPGVEPMEIGALDLKKTKCFYCKNLGHVAADCYKKKKHQAAQGSQGNSFAKGNKPPFKPKPKFSGTSGSTFKKKPFFKKKSGKFFKRRPGYRRFIKELVAALGEGEEDENDSEEDSTESEAESGEEAEGEEPTEDSPEKEDAQEHEEHETFEEKPETDF